MRWWEARRRRKCKYSRKEMLKMKQAKEQLVHELEELRTSQNTRREGRSSERHNEKERG